MQRLSRLSVNIILIWKLQVLRRLKEYVLMYILIWKSVFDIIHCHTCSFCSLVSFFLLFLFPPSQVTLDLKRWSLWNICLVCFQLPFSCTSGESFSWGWRVEGGWAGWFCRETYYLNTTDFLQSKEGGTSHRPSLTWVTDSWLETSHILEWVFVSDLTPTLTKMESRYC